VTNDTMLEEIFNTNILNTLLPGLVTVYWNCFQKPTWSHHL